MKKIALLGSTGSIGRQVLDVVSRNEDKFKIVALSANNNAELLTEQMWRYKPIIATLSDSESAKKITEIPNGTSFYYGENANLHACFCDADLVVVAIMGFAGLKCVLSAIESGKDVAVANKETLVAGGKIVIELAEEKGVNILPIDSEHSAIWQALGLDRKKEFSKLLITASGGAFRDTPIEDLPYMTAADALRHPNWNMGKKITVDCATMVNKGLEVIEAKWLFNAPLDKIEVLYHPESIVHSLVEFKDGAVIAQMGVPDMRLPVSLALSYPERLDRVGEPLNLVGKNLHFDKLDESRYPCFPLVIKSATLGDNYPCALSGANEEAVKLFLDGRIKFTEIYDYISFALDKTVRADANYTALVDTDARARLKVYERFNARKLG